MKKGAFLLYLLINQITFAKNYCNDAIQYCYDIETDPVMAVNSENQSKDEIFFQTYCSILFKNGCDKYEIQVEDRRVVLGKDSLTIKESCEKISEFCKKEQD